MGTTSPTLRVVFGRDSFEGLELGVEALLAGDEASFEDEAPWVGLGVEHPATKVNRLIIAAQRLTFLRCRFIVFAICQRLFLRIVDVELAKLEPRLVDLRL